MNTVSRDWECGSAHAADKAEYLACYIAAGTRVKTCINTLLQKDVPWQHLVAVNSATIAA